jgi:DNA-binding beta-propeller fold protein YncE
VADFGKAACWIATSDGFAYVANAASGTISGYSVDADGGLALLSPDGVSATTGPGPIDVAAADGVLYVENGGDSSLSAYAVGADGALIPVATVTGLTADGGPRIEGLVAV